MVRILFHPSQLRPLRALHPFHSLRPAITVTVCAAVLGAGSALAQKDTAWTPIFNGKNLDGLYLRSGGGTLQNPATQSTFKFEDGVLNMTNPGPTGALCTQSNYSYYHVRVQYQFASATGTPNSGMLYHVDSLDWLPTDAYGSKTAVDRVPSLQPSCGGNWFPKSFELQMRRNETGAIYGVANVWGETFMKDGHYDPAGSPRSITPSYNSGPKNMKSLKSEWPDGPGNWVTMEAMVYGADSVIHIVNGMRVFKMTNLRHNRVMVPCGQGGGTWGTGAQLPLASGHTCVQVEGAAMQYRNWEMRPLPKGGGPTAIIGKSEGHAGYAVLARRVPGQRLAGLEAIAPASHRGPMELAILSSRGEKVRTFRLTGGSETVAWDLADGLGRPVSPGLYLVRLSAGGHAASRALLVD